ncbi:MAG: hypothetical protein SNJ82_01025, partial [Gemmataceae bacterium]
LKEYPTDQIVLYAEGYSVSRFLIERSNRQAFLAFVADGMRPEIGWDKALQAHYNIRRVEDLEAQWLETLKQPPRLPQSDTLLASGSAGSGSTASGSSMEGKRNVEVVSRGESSTRRTLPPVTPVLGTPRPVVRGVRGEENVREVSHDRGWAAPTMAPASSQSAVIVSPVGVSLGTPRVKPVGYPD